MHDYLSTSTIGYYTLKIAMGWDDAHLHRFRIHGKDYGISCIGGKHAAPPQNCGGPRACMALQDEYSPGYFLDCYADLLESVRTGDRDEARDQLAEREPLQQEKAV